MQILDHDTILINPATGAIDETLDAVIDATDQAHAWGKEDALEGRQQSAACFLANSDCWLAYHEGYREGSILAAFLTGTTRRYWLPAQPLEIQAVSWNTEPSMGVYQCPVCKEFYDPTYGHQCPGPQRG